MISYFHSSFYDVLLSLFFVRLVNAGLQQTTDFFWLGPSKGLFVLFETHEPVNDYSG